MTTARRLLLALLPALLSIGCPSADCPEEGSVEWEDFCGTEAAEETGCCHGEPPDDDAGSQDAGG